MEKRVTINKEAAFLPFSKAEMTEPAFITNESPDNWDISATAFLHRVFSEKLQIYIFLRNVEIKADNCHPILHASIRRFIGISSWPFRWFAMGLESGIHVRANDRIVFLRKDYTQGVKLSYTTVSSLPAIYQFTTSYQTINIRRFDVFLPE